MGNPLSSSTFPFIETFVLAHELRIVSRKQKIINFVNFIFLKFWLVSDYFTTYKVITRVDVKRTSTKNTMQKKHQ
jgi:hypothetical protein